MKDNNGRFIKGSGGRPKGAKNKATSDLRIRISEFLDSNWEDMLEDFKQLEPVQRLQFYEKLIAYSLPKLQAIEYKSIVEDNIDKLSDKELNELINVLLEKNDSTKTEKEPD